MKGENHWRDTLLPRSDGMPSVASCRLLLHSLQRGAPTCVAASINHIYPSAALASQLKVWKRRGLIDMIVLEDLTDPELERLLFNTAKGRFQLPDFAALHERIWSSNLPIYPEWLAHFRGTTGRPHFPATFLDAYLRWREAMGIAPRKRLQIRLEYVHKVFSAHELQKGVPTWPGVTTVIEWG